MSVGMAGSSLRGPCPSLHVTIGIIRFGHGYRLLTSMNFSARHNLSQGLSSWRHLLLLHRP